MNTLKTLVALSFITLFMAVLSAKRSRQAHRQ
ncbi:hypothetical protein EC836_104113 [Erwinia sp. JUb26]|nr:hypothetical protein EC836_104113 [Erwinia sp. JUb26]